MSCGSRRRVSSGDHHRCTTAAQPGRSMICTLSYPRSARVFGGHLRTLRSRRGVGAFAMVIAAAIVLGGCDWTQFRYGPARTGFYPNETKLSPTNVGTLAEAW